MDSVLDSDGKLVVLLRKNIENQSYATDYRIIDLPRGTSVRGLVYTSASYRKSMHMGYFDGVGLLDYENIQHMEGKVLTILDAVFTSEEQRKAIKDLVRQALWDHYKAEKNVNEYYGKDLIGSNEKA